MEGLRVLESSVELLSDFTMSGLTLLIGICIVGSMVAAVRALRRGTPVQAREDKEGLPLGARH